MYLVKVVETKKEHDDAFAVRTKVFVEEQGIPLHVEYDVYDSTATHFVLYEEDEAVGAARLRIVEEGIAKIERVSVLQTQRGKKLGALIMKEIEKHAITININKLKLHAQSYTVPFYQKLGYTVTSPEFMDADIPHRAMEKCM